MEGTNATKLFRFRPKTFSCKRGLRGRLLRVSSQNFKGDGVFLLVVSRSVKVLLAKLLSLH